LVDRASLIGEQSYRLRVAPVLTGDGGGQAVSYEKGRSVPSGEGILEDALDGDHGWFWRNGDTTDVALTLRIKADYVKLKRVI
jgi:hypothetical protein